MEAPTLERSRLLAYRIHDRIPLPEDVAVLEAMKGDEGIVRELILQGDGSVVAFVEVSYSTGQTRGWVFVEVMPEGRVISYIQETA